jgi:serine/threonine protein kinase
MPRPRSAMRQIREVLRLAFEERLSRRQIGAAVGLPYTTVWHYLERARQAGLSWPLPDQIDDRELESWLFVTADVVPIIDSGEHKDHWVLVMPRADTSLRDHLDRSQGLRPLEEVVEILKDVCDALSDLSSKIVHRDLKPENLLLLNGHWCLADFGISRYAEATTARIRRSLRCLPRIPHHHEICRSRDTAKRRTRNVVTSCSKRRTGLAEEAEQELLVAADAAAAPMGGGHRVADL